ncbi:MAG TPA: type II toxin-antitoxin system PemK/MazF family toxin [Kiritimatiellia bacterium]|nr:type II toxin-antitoxin system PemK/MazF family toxin [Kiritimatiellia bacterium]
MIECSPASVVLVRFPFSDLNATKQRPAVVVSSVGFSTRHGDILLVPLTSVSQPDGGLQISEWQAAGLLKPTWIKPMLATLSQSLITRFLGTLHVDDVPRVRAALAVMLAPSFCP